MNSQNPRTITSFRKKGADVLNIRGTRISTHNAQLLTSTGLSTLDFFIGGGLPIGTICLIEEDPHDIASKVVMKYFLSEGVVQNHKIFLSSGGKASSQVLLNELPDAKTIELKPQIKEKQAAEEVMKIAIQYQNQPPVQDAHLKVSYFNQGFDLSKTMPSEMVQKSSVESWDPTQDCHKPEMIPNFISCPYSHLLENIKSHIIKSGLKIPSKTCQTILRVGICSLGSPLWIKDDSHCSSELQLIRFLYVLKSLLRTSFAVALITVPSYLTQNLSLISRIRQMCDIVVSFESFEGTKLAEYPAFQNFSGLIHMTKLAVLNSCLYPMKTADLAYKIKRKELIIERLHLQPDFEDNAEKTTTSGCCSGSSCNSKLDY